MTVGVSGTGEPPPARLSAARKLVFTLVLAVASYGVVEIFSFAAFWIADGEPFRLSRIRSERAAAMASAELPARPSQFMVVHPYLGFVVDPALARGIPQIANDFGFTKNERGPIYARAPNRIVIGVVGGSVAQLLGYGAEQLLEPHLAKAPAFAGKELVFVVLANGGYKQPQQLMTLSYILAMGGELDVLINVDGVNDVSLAPFENVPRGVHPLFPRDWSGLVSGLRHPRAQLLAGRAAFLSDVDGGWTRVLAAAPLRYSLTALFVWRAGHRWLGAAAAARLAQARAIEGEGTPFYVTGPKAVFADEDALFEELAAAWKRCSLQLHRLCHANGIRYLHFLQPSQYVPGSKPIGDVERSIALNDGSPFKRGVLRGYPRLQREGRDLVRQGVSFWDLTGIFGGIQDPTYADDCCHYNPLGNAILGQRIAEALIANFP